MDYRDHRPDLNAKLFALLASGVGLRQSARLLEITLRCCELKFRKLARHLRRLNINLRAPLPNGCSFQLDEIETYEGRRNTRPLSVPLLIERETRFIVWAESAPIRPRGSMSKARLRAIAQDEERLGTRRDCSRSSVARTLRRGACLTGNLSRVIVDSDEKSSYPKLAREAFGAHRLVHHRTSSRLPRTPSNPLYAINHTEAMLRDLTGRLRRESWLASKKRRYLDLGLQLITAWRNYVRKRFNPDLVSAAAMLGFVPRLMSEDELCSWRQDWGANSIHPLATRAESIAQRLDVRTARA